MEEFKRFRLKALRNLKKINADELAKEIGVSSRTISSWENNDTIKMPVTALVKICNYFNVPASIFFEGTEKETYTAGSSHLTSQFYEDIGKISDKQTVIMDKFEELNKKGNELFELYKEYNTLMKSVTDTFQNISEEYRLVAEDKKDEYKKRNKKNKS